MATIYLDKRSVKIPKCPKDKTVLLHHCIRNGVLFVEGGQGAQPERIWNADLYHCTACKNQVLTDFGTVPQWTKENTADLSGFIERAKAGGAMVLYAWQFEAPRARTTEAASNG